MWWEWAIAGVITSIAVWWLGRSVLRFLRQTAGRSSGTTRRVSLTVGGTRPGTRSKAGADARSEGGSEPR